jgi:hypothetical protein
LDIFSSDISGGAVKFFGKLCKADRGEGCHAQFSLWASMMKAGLRSVKRWAKELEADGYIKRVRAGGPISIFVNPKCRVASGFEKCQKRHTRSAKIGTPEVPKLAQAADPLYINSSYIKPVKQTLPTTNMDTVAVGKNVDALIDAGIDPLEAQRLAQIHSISRVASVVKYVTKTTATNSPGLVVAALRDGYHLPSWAEVKPAARGDSGPLPLQTITPREVPAEVVASAQDEERMELMAGDVVVVVDGTKVPLVDYLDQHDPWGYNARSAAVYGNFNLGIE